MVYQRMIRQIWVKVCSNFNSDMIFPILIWSFQFLYDFPDFELFFELEWVFQFWYEFLNSDMNFQNLSELFRLIRSCSEFPNSGMNFPILIGISQFWYDFLKSDANFTVILIETDRSIWAYLGIGIEVEQKTWKNCEIPLAFSKRQDFVIYRSIFIVCECGIVVLAHSYEEHETPTKVLYRKKVTSLISWTPLKLRHQWRRKRYREQSREKYSFSFISFISTAS